MVTMVRYPNVPCFLFTHYWIKVMSLSPSQFIGKENNLSRYF